MTDFDIILRLAAGAGAALLMGLERARRMHFVGARTFGLIGLAGAAAAIVGRQMSGSDPQVLGHVLQGVLTGVGFVGAGVIMHPLLAGSARGVTTAAAVWLAAVVGFCAGLGAWTLTAAGGLIGFLLLLAPEPFAEPRPSPRRQRRP